MTSLTELEVSQPAEQRQEAELLTRPRGRGTFRRVFRRPSTAFAGIVIVVMFVVALTSEFLAPYDPAAKDFDAVLEGPSRAHLLGTDKFGADILSQLIAGTRVTLIVSLGSVGLAILIGVPFGLLLGYKGGWWDRLGARLMDISDALPGMLVAFAVIAILGRGLGNIVVAIGLVFCMSLARMTRAVTLVEREKEFVDAAKVSGLRAPTILFREILPNLVVPLTAQASIMLGSAIIVESTLSFLNIGIDGASWGGMLSDATEQLNQHPWMAFPPGVAIVVAVLSFNLVANGISDVMGGTSQGVMSRASRTATLTARKISDERSLPDEEMFEPGALLEVRGVTVGLHRADGGPVPIVENAWLSIRPGEVLGLLGESGSGKSMLARSMLGLLRPPTFLAGGSVLLDGEVISPRRESAMGSIRGRQIAAVFQNPASALSPVHTIGRQISEPLRLHFGLTRNEARARAVELLDRVGVEHPERRLDDYPHQFSGGMAQRVAIAMALAAEPKVLIADEATSALDVTTQAQVLDLLLELRDSTGMSILLITHDLGVVAETCDRAAVMYAGQIVEVGDVRSLFDRPRHPYTAALLEANPALDHHVVGRRPVIAGRVPPPGEWPAGCHFAGRCRFAAAECTSAPVAFVDGVRCVRTEALVQEVGVG
jgi:oligopeptide/dipeptide ABC transporter ATP-binding protein